MPSNTGAPGGKRVGVKMTHYIIVDGPFDLAFARMPKDHLLPWCSGTAGLGGAVAGARKDPSKVKYTCPTCAANVWGKLGLRVMCGECDEPFECAA